MKSTLRWGLAAWMSALALSVHGETLRCNGRAAEIGDSRLSVLRQCGEPVLKDSFCAPLYLAPTAGTPVQPWFGPTLPCLLVDEWLYDRGPGNLVATVRFQFGVIQSIRYGQAPP